MEDINREEAEVSTNGFFTAYAHQQMCPVCKALPLNKFYGVIPVAILGKDTTDWVKGDIKSILTVSASCLCGEITTYEVKQSTTEGEGPIFKVKHKDRVSRVKGLGVLADHPNNQ